MKNSIDVHVPDREPRNGPYKEERQEVSLLRVGTWSQVGIKEIRKERKGRSAQGSETVK